MYKRQPLLVAAWGGNEAVVRALMEAGADVNKATDDGETPLLQATFGGHEAVAQLLKRMPVRRDDD